MLKPAQKHLDEGRWWDEPWGLANGCTPVSPGCAHCWSASIAHRFGKGLTNEAGAFSGDVVFREDLLDVPLRRRKPTVWAVWNDLFHEALTAEQITTAFDYMDRDMGIGSDSPHLFFVLTKRPERVGPVLWGEEGRWYLGGGDYMSNVWLGTTVENQAAADERIPYLADWWPFERCLSVEPLLEPVTLDLSNVDWVIVGGESGAGARPCEERWIANVIDQCGEQRTPVFLKQMGTVWARGRASNWAYADTQLSDHPKDRRGWMKLIGSKGQLMDAWPVDLQVREWPA